MIFWMIPLGWFVLCVALVPFMVHMAVAEHVEFQCDKVTCKQNQAHIRESEERKLLTQRRCSARYVHGHTLVLPFMLLGFLPRAIAYGTINRMLAKDERVAKLEKEAKARELELAKAKELEASRTKTDMRNFDKLMKMVEDGIVKV